MRNVEVGECLFVRPPDATGEQALECSDIRCGSESRHHLHKNATPGSLLNGFCVVSCDELLWHRPCVLSIVRNVRNELERWSGDVKSSHYSAMGEIEAANP